MKKRKEIALDFEIDKLTNSIENTLTNEVFDTEITRITLRISIMVNFKKIDDHDFVFVNKPITQKEDKEFSNFLKNRKSGIKSKPNLRT